MKYLGFLPAEVPTGHSKLGYYMRAGVEKVIGSVESIGGSQPQFETSK
jgi:hydrogenase small subunit